MRSLRVIDRAFSKGDEGDVALRVTLRLLDRLLIEFGEKYRDVFDYLCKD